MASQASLLLRGLAFAAAMSLLAPPAQAQRLKSENLALCNGGPTIAADQQLAGCSALIALGGENEEGMAKLYNNRGNAYAKQGEFPEALQDYDRAIKLHPGYALALKNRGVAHYRMGKLDDAIATFSDLLQSKKDVDVLVGRAQAFSAKQDHRRALQDYDEAIRLEPKRAAIWNARCWTRAIVGEFQPALADCNEAIKLEPKTATPLDSRGFVHLRMNRWNAAIDDYNAALRLNAKLASALYGRGLAKQKTGRAVSGRSDIAAAKAVQPAIVEEFARYGAQ
jgi:tetratricopeptide (TPR) repeat protein